MSSEKLHVYRQLLKHNKWQDSHNQLTKNEQFWLTGNESLTKQLVSISKIFEVNVLIEQTETCLESEASKLGIDKNSLVRVREVELICDEIPVVYARSIIPLEALNGEGKALEALGDKPLGQLLFKQATVDIHTREVMKLPLIETDKWARRTIYNFNEQDILVSEYFLFDVNNLNTRNKKI